MESNAKGDTGSRGDFFKSCVHCLLCCFVFYVLKRALVKLGEKFLVLLQKFFLSRKTKFRILDIQISWCHQMPKHKARIAFYWINREVNTVCLSHIAMEKFYQKVQKKRNLKTSSRSFYICKELSTSCIEEQACLKQAAYIRYKKNMYVCSYPTFSSKKYQL